MKKLLFVTIFIFASSMLYAQVGLVKGAKGLLVRPRVPVIRPHIPQVNPGGRNPFAINPAICGVLVNALDTNRTMQRVGPSGQIGNLTPVHLPTPTPLVNPSMDFPHLFEMAVPARPWPTNQDETANYRYRALARKVQAINDSIR